MGRFKEIEDEFVTFDQKELFYRGWIPQRFLKKTKDDIFIGVHGAGTHSNNLKFLGEFLASKGYRFYAYDKRGHGHWKYKNKGHIEDYQHNILDIKCFIDFIKEKDDPERIFLIGHSMGGSQVLAYAIQYPEVIEAIVVSSPCLKLVEKGFRKLQKIGSKIISPLAPKMSVGTGIDQRILTTDEEITEDHLNDPLRLQTFTTKYGLELFELQEYLKENLQKLEVPTFFVLAGDDKLVDTNYSKEMFKKIADKNKMELEVYEGHFHENFNETPERREKVFKDIVEYLDL